ncbi:hypothetical protein BMIN10S_02119 [Bosea minatitlanensis]
MISAADDLPYLYRWDRHGRKGEPCQVTARGKMNSVRVVFADGFTMITSGNALRRRGPSVQESLPARRDGCPE